MQQIVADFVKMVYIAHGPFERVLDVGSYDVNGSVRKELMTMPTPPKEFLGIDMREGPGVDRVLNGHHMLEELLPDSYDLITCCETLEHDNMFWLTVNNMTMVLKEGGYMVITVPGYNFPAHDFPHDYYRFSVDAVKQMFAGFKNIYVCTKKEHGYTSVLGYGKKL